MSKPRKPVEVTCFDCGCTFIAKSSRALRCTKCRVKAKRETSKMWMESQRRGYRRENYPKICPKLTIGEVLRKQEEYNKAHRKNLSYGQFVLILEKGAIE